MIWPELKFVMILLLAALVLMPVIVTGVNSVVNNWWRNKLIFWKSMAEIIVSQKKHDV